MKEIIPGRYRHYKGNAYSVLGLAKHSESQEELVVYRQEYGDHGLWVRPKAMFLENVMIDGRELPRFELMELNRDNDPVDMGNLLIDLPTHLPEEINQTILSNPNLRIERIISDGQVSPEGFWYDQDQHEWVLVLQGAARLHFEGDEKPIGLNPGDYINIPAHKKHQVEWTSYKEPTIWLAVFYG